ncbi:hypothetical protein V1224_00220 [Lachnospiraceae bacterium JLR.KK008]
MNYKSIIENFIKEYPDYKSDVANFEEYLETYWGNSLSGDSFRILLKGIDVEFILKSLIYNVEEVRRIKSKTKAKRYSTVIGQLFNYIRKTTDIVNPELYDAISYNRLRENSYMKQMMSYILKCDMLAGIVEQEALSSDQIEKIIKWTDEQLDGQDWIDETKFKKAMAAIGIKMMTAYGLTYRELRKIKWSDCDSIYGFVTVNGFELRLPPKLAIQLGRMERFVLERKIVTKKDSLFVNCSGEPWADVTSYSGIPDYLGALIDVTSVTSIIKYGIGQLLKAGLSDSVIKEITGASDKIIQNCLVHEDCELKRIVNNKIAMAEFYYEL